MPTKAAAFIVDNPLPLALDFLQLKAAGIAQIKSQTDQIWTNFNDSDPGVTMLEQLCYALTELGYCAQMPIEDVLTQNNGAIPYAKQFFVPQDILSTNPVTIDDFRKFIHDSFTQVRAIYLTPQTCTVKNDGSNINAQPIKVGRYLVYVGFDETVSLVDQGSIRNGIDYLLQQHRNLGEFFYPAKLLSSQRVTISGRVQLSPTVRASNVYAQITQALSQIAAPTPVRSGYTELINSGLAADQVINGPKMHQGWISGADALPAKLTSISTNQIAALLSAIDGVVAVESIGIAANNISNFIIIDEDKIATFDFIDTLQFIQNRQPIPRQAANIKKSTHYVLGKLQAAHLASGVESKVDVNPPLPVGRYRDIETYYSIQNTFPDSYGVGANSLESNAPNYRIANARQLKAYLLVFDQLLANEFSQLAHVNDLFSFVPQQTILGSSVLSPMIQYKPFTSSYYCQTLYDIPDVKPLLRGNESFHYQFDRNMPSDQSEAIAWDRFQQFPFNEYSHGLLECMEQPLTANRRRDDMLSHLMARHGDDANDYQSMMHAYQSYGTDLETNIIVKSKWMLNFQVLSYYRMKASNCRSSVLIRFPDDPSIVPTHNWIPSSLPDCVSAGKCLPWWLCQPYPSKDGELDQEKLFAICRIEKEHLENFTAFEHKLDILLGLSGYFLHLAGKLFALLAQSQSSGWLSNNEPQSVFYCADVDATFFRVSEQEDRLYLGDRTDTLPGVDELGLMQIILPSISKDNQAFRRQCYQDHAQQLLWLATQRKGCLLIEHQLLFAEIQTDVTQDIEFIEDIFSASLLLPNYVSIIGNSNSTRTSDTTLQMDLANYLITLTDLHWPAHLTLQTGAYSFSFMKAMIPAFLHWHNASNPVDQDSAATIVAKLLQLHTPVRNSS